MLRAVGYTKKSTSKLLLGNKLQSSILSNKKNFIAGFSTVSSSKYDSSLNYGSKSWLPRENDHLQKVTTQALIHEISLESMDSAKTYVPWFLKNMPASYFNQIPESLRRQHIKAVGAIRDFKQSGLSLKIRSLNDAGTLEMLTVITSSSAKSLLYDQISNLQIPPNSRLSRVQVFTSLDGELSLNVFSFESDNRSNAVATSKDASHILEYIDEMRAGAHKSDTTVPAYDDSLFSNEAMNAYYPLITQSYAQNSNPKRFVIQKEMYHKVCSNDGVEISVQDYSGQHSGPMNDSLAWITIAASNVLPEVLFRLTAKILRTREMHIVRAHLDDIVSHQNSTPEVPGFVTMLRLLVSPAPNNKCAAGDEMDTFLREIKRAKWLDDQVTNMGLEQYPQLGVEKAEIITALISMLHGPLSKADSSTYGSIKTMISILDGSQHFISFAEQIAGLFQDKFRPAPRLSTEDFTRRGSELEAKISRLHHDSARTLLLKMLEAVKLTLRTNLYCDDRYALSLRVNPQIMATGNIGKEGGKPLPFGVFFIHGRHFNAFHCRFRDIARGGLRIVTPPNAEQHALESSRQFDEAYGLSYAQQLKNKDIPEGGSKAVVLVNAPAIAKDKQFFAARKSVKAFTDSLLDLIVTDSVSNLVDYYGKDELIYLGPDEQVIPSDIDWICHRALQRGYPIPAAFMSSKKMNGINHKEFGVTSEGVVVYLDVALRNVLNINPHKDPFTIKITGGPDGDVAGNLIRILYREYGENCKVVGIADGFGCAEDPNGLDSTELLRLVHESLPITSFNRSKLSKSGCMMDISTEEGLGMRLTMCFRVKADAFVPAGGRPNTINIDNWNKFLDPATGEPSSKLIVEGANIFTTPDAREALFNEAGVTIVKDSSANKCGVITSSCEVAASMLLSKEEFMDIKKELVDDVLVNLRHLARLEAELLFREYKNYPGALPHFSERISNAINVATDAITDALADVQPTDPLFIELVPLIKDNLPKKLANVAWDRVAKRFPVQYQKNAIASTLASKLVYQEGIHLVETQPLNRLAERAIMYYREDLKIKELVSEIESGDALSAGGNKDKILSLLKRGGARASLGIF